MHTIIMDLGLGLENNAKFSQIINSNGDYLICDLSFDQVYWKEYVRGFPEISYFTFCNMMLRKAFLKITETKKNLLILNFNYQDLSFKTFELLYLLSLIMPLDPILIDRTSNDFLQNNYGILFNRFVQFDPDVDFGIDLQRRINDELSRKSEIAEVISIFNSYGTILSFGKIPADSEIIKLKENVGMPISYDEFVNILLNKQKSYTSDQSFIGECISHLMIVREHNPIDLFIEKFLKEKS